MPIIPTVFRPIRANDVQTRPVKTYKRYTITSGSASGSGCRVHSGIHNLYAVHVGDDTYNYPVNYDGTNQHVVWRSTDHRYYRYPYDPARSHEHTDRRKTEKFLFYSSSALNIPYFDVGERIKPGSLTIHFTTGSKTITLEDDGLGNLRDPSILTSSFATASHCFFYMGFNNEFRQFERNFGYIETGSVEYILLGDTYRANCTGVNIEPGNQLLTNGLGELLGIHTTDKSGLGIVPHATEPFGGIIVPHHEAFNKFNKCDRWTISLWTDTYAEFGNQIFLSKGARRTEQYLDTKSTRRLIRTRTVYDESWPALSGVLGNDVVALQNRRTPFVIGQSDAKAFFMCSNGSTSLLISGSKLSSLCHIAVTNDNNYVTLYVNGNPVASGTMPPDSTANNSDVEIGSSLGRSPLYGTLDEIRMYDYAATPSEIKSLANRDYMTGSLYQTNVAGNVFYRNGQIVISSVMPKYHLNSGFFNLPFTASYRGTHTVYENEVLVRIPADQFNYTLNPSATYRPGTDGSNNDCNATPNGAQSNNGPGDLYLSSFVSGTVGPYITTVGLYNDKQQLLAVGKLGTAITKRSDVDTNIIIRWDY